MIGHAVEAGETRRPPAAGEVLHADGLTAPGAVAGVSLVVRRGEILGLAGLVGSGALEATAALAGAFPVRTGSLRLEGRPLRAGDRVAAHRRGVGLLTGAREEAGVFPGLSALANASVSILGELAPLGWLRGRRERQRLLPWFERLSVSPVAPGLAIERFSGGNQQKILAIRALAMSDMRLLVALDPTRGVDVGARAVVHQALAEAAARGAGVVVFSSDLEELVTLGHRILTMREGRVVAEFPVPVPTSSILAALTGAAP
jgi:ribose transport system ATP-binding protein/rhamnose transport system ATP-binding protein